MSKGKFYMTYELEPKPEGVSEDDVLPAKGVCDSAVVIAIFNEPGGVYRQGTRTLDGQTGEPLNEEQRFKAWLLWAMAMGNDQKMSPGLRLFAKNVFESWEKLTNIQIHCAQEGDPVDPETKPN